MAEPLGGLSKSAAATVGRVVRQVLGRLPDVGRRTRRVPYVSGASGGFGTERVVFTIDSYDSDTGIAICTVKYRPFGSVTVSDEVAGKIDVEDPAGCYFNEEEYDLVGRWGHADYMTAAGDSYNTGVWVVSGLCCPVA